MQHLLLLVIAMLIAGLTFTVIKWPGGMHMTFSQHAATTKWSKIYYALLFVVTLPLLMWFFAGWLVPVKGLPTPFLWFAGIAVSFQILCTWVPEEGGVKTTVHRLLAGISGVAMLPLVYIIAASQTLSTGVKSSALVGFVAMLAILGVAALKQKGFRWALLLQIGYYAVFLAVLLVVTYI